MPFDPIGFNQTHTIEHETETEEYPLIRSPEGLRVLARALRAEMPSGFTFDFGELYTENECGSVGCGIGLAKILWFSDKGHLGTLYMSEVFGVSSDDLHKLFIIPGVPFIEIGPTRLANAIDHYLDTGEIWPPCI